MTKRRFFAEWDSSFPCHAELPDEKRDGNEQIRDFEIGHCGLSVRDVGQGLVLKGLSLAGLAKEERTTTERAAGYWSLRAVKCCSGCG